VGTRTSGSGGGGEQTTARERGTAARLRPYIEIVRRSSRNVKRWQSGDTCLRWTAAGILAAERQFRRVIGYRDLAKLALAVERELNRQPIEEVVAVTPARNNPSADRHRQSTASGTSSSQTDEHFPQGVSSFGWSRTRTSG
jgi:hypothetical protein